MELLKVCDVTKIYHSGEVSIKALDNINLSIKKGEFVAIIGKSGSGKSTLLNAISGLEKVSSGLIQFDAKEITTMKDKELSKLRRKRIGFVFQGFHLLPEFNAIENILLPYCFDNEEPDMEYINYVLTHLNLTGLTNRFPNQLSGGEQQRVAIARALATRPDIIFADEPTGRLDIKNGQEVMELFSMLQRKLGQTIIIVTHDLDIAKMADTIVYLEDGKIVHSLEGSS